MHPNPALGLSTPLRELVDRRAVHYDPWFDVRVWPKEGATLEELEENVLKRLDEYLKAHCDIYNSTRCTVNEEPLNFFAMTWNFSQGTVHVLIQLNNKVSQQDFSTLFRFFS